VAPTRFAKRRGGYVHFIDDLQVLSSPRRYDQWPAWRILLWTNPLFALLFRHRRSIWRGGTTIPCGDLTRR
jgi:hypothetical protein